MEGCVYPSCTDTGVIQGKATGPDGAELVGWLCFPHAFPTEPELTPETDPSDNYRPEGWTAPAPVVEPDEPSTTFYPEVTAGLAAMVLEHAAMAMRDTDDAATEAMTSLATNTLFGNDVAAGVILAITAVAAAGGVTAQALMELAEQYEGLADDDEPEPDPIGRYMAAASMLDAIADEVGENHDASP